MNTSPVERLTLLTVIASYSTFQMSLFILEMLFPHVACTISLLCFLPSKLKANKQITWKTDLAAMVVSHHDCVFGFSVLLGKHVQLLR